MQRRVIVGGVVAAAVVSAGATTVLATTTSSDAGTPSASAAAHPHRTGAHGRHHRGLLRHLAHGELTVRRHGDFVTLDVIRGTVTSVSSSLVTVRAADATSQTFVVTGTTTVVQRADHHRTDSTIGAVRTGDRVLVVGTGRASRSAVRVVDRGAAPARS